MQVNELIKSLTDALFQAEQHLEYCSWGDRWERECAMEQKLPELIETALTKAREYISTLPKE